jgi:hypothetical protein
VDGAMTAGAALASMVIDDGIVTGLTDRTARVGTRTAVRDDADDDDGLITDGIDDDWDDEDAVTLEVALLSGAVLVSTHDWRRAWLMFTLVADDADGMTTTGVGVVTLLDVDDTEVGNGTDDDDVRILAALTILTAAATDRMERAVCGDALLLLSLLVTLLIALISSLVVGTTGRGSSTIADDSTRVEPISPGASIKGVNVLPLLVLLYEERRPIGPLLLLLPLYWFIDIDGDRPYDGAVADDDDDGGWGIIGDDNHAWDGVRVRSCCCCCGAYDGERFIRGGVISVLLLLLLPLLLL